MSVTFSAADRFHPLHNGYLTLMTGDDGATYVSVEQLMMRAKADLFPDNEEVARKIMATTDYAQIKALGRQVVGFDPIVWSAHCETIVERACEIKFAQDVVARAALLSTGDATLAQESDTDAIWSSPGRNLMGQILERVRSRLWMHLL